MQLENEMMFDRDILPCNKLTTDRRKKVVARDF